MMMSTRNSEIALAIIGLCLCFILTDASKDCDLKQCPGPLYYYEELGCLPIYDNASDCCPTRYNCDAWKNLPVDKCFANGQSYKLNEVIPREVLNKDCWTCRCRGSAKLLPICLTSMCAGPGNGCYFKKKPYECCKGIAVCPKEGEKIPTCTVDGITYNDGEVFRPLAAPDKICTCLEGYTGSNVEPFCISAMPSRCGNALFAPSKIRANCAPVYSQESSLKIHCNKDFRCHNVDTDFILAGETEPSEDQLTLQTSQLEDTDMSCKFGNLTMRIGELLNPVKIGEFNVMCVCEVPPVLTCRDELPPTLIKGFLHFFRQYFPGIQG